MKKLTRKDWNLRVKKIASIEGVKLPKLPKKRGYSDMFKKGLSPVQAVAKITIPAKRIIRSYVEPDKLKKFANDVGKLLKPYSLKVTPVIEEGEEEEELGMQYLALEVEFENPYIAVDNVYPLDKLHKLITKKVKETFRGKVTFDLPNHEGTIFIYELIDEDALHN